MAGRRSQTSALLKTLKTRWRVITKRDRFVAEGEGFKPLIAHGRGASFETTGSDLRARNLLPPGACDWARTDPYEGYGTSSANGARVGGEIGQPR
jgi:hypothetical protein